MCDHLWDGYFEGWEAGEESGGGISWGNLFMVSHKGRRQ